MGFDIIRFIKEIEKRPAIWDMKSSQYSDRYEKVKQWEEIITLFSDGVISAKQKKEKGRILQTKWKNFRDSFLKESRKQARLKIGGPSTGTSQYRFYNQLMFLKPYAATANKDTPGVVSVEVEDEPVRPDVEMPPPKKKPRRTLPEPSEEIGRELVVALKSSLNQTDNTKEDSDRQFMLSLVPDLKKVPDRLKSVVKMNLLKCITEAQDEAYKCHCGVQCKTEQSDTFPS